MRAVVDVSAIPSRAPGGSPPRVVPPIAVPGVIPRVEAEAPSPAADGEGGIAPSPPAVAVGPVVVPAVVPVAVIGRGAPRAEHRGDVLGLDPHLVARDHDVVEGRVVGGQIGELAAVAEVVVARRHAVGGRLEAAQTARIGALVGVCQHILIGVRVVIGRLGVGRFGLGEQRLPLGATGFGLGAAHFGAGLLLFGDGLAVVQSVEVVRRVACFTVEGRGAPRRN